MPFETLLPEKRANPCLETDGAFGPAAQAHPVGRTRMDYPKTYKSADELPSVLRIVREVLPRLLEGDDPILVVLRKQLRHLVVGSVELTGWGFSPSSVFPPTPRP